MMSEKVTDNPSINETELKSFSEIIKDKIFNKVFAYVVISFLIFNWKDILIILKSKDDILYTLSIVFVGGNVPFFDNWIVSPWVYHVVIPFVYGVFASVLAPILTLKLSKLTSKLYTEIRYLDEAADYDKRIELQRKKTKLNQATNDAKYSKQILDENENKLNDLAKKQREICGAIKLLHTDVGSIIELYKNKGVSIESPQDLCDFIVAIKSTSFYNDDKHFNKLVSDISSLFDNTGIDLSKK
ncbi:hypothetical protein [Escherichia coli]|uniref:hypothetical protein n=1 Tax=Escherichia coli TaxID=562 RepID=UPI00226F8D1D|nr:hypothetical protein [Escherichia coli]MCX9955994.1 hypothetical protein [Escherichia coli]